MRDAGFESFFRENENVIFRIIKNYVRERDIAKDILMETMYVVYRKWDRVQYFENKTGYAVRIGINRAKKHLIEMKIHSKVRFFKEGEEHELHSHRESPEVSVLSKEEDGWLESEMDRLKEVEKNVILMKDLESMKFEEIARIFGLKLPTLKSIYRRAKMKLSKKWEERYGGK